MDNKSFENELDEIKEKSINDIVSIICDKIKDTLRNATKECHEEVRIDIYPMLPPKIESYTRDKIVMRISKVLGSKRITVIPYLNQCYIKVLL